MRGANITTGLRLRLVLAEGMALGPGKAMLLDEIARTGSISGASQAMGMSYKRAWDLVAELNAMFREPLVQTTVGGSTRGGARLTPLGASVLARYRSMEKKAEKAAHREAASLTKDLKTGP